MMLGKFLRAVWLSALGEFSRDIERSRPPVSRLRDMLRGA